MSASASSTNGDGGVGAPGVAGGVASGRTISSILHSQPRGGEQPPEYLQLLRIACGAAAGAFTKTCIAPLERIKIIHQTQGMSEPASGVRYGGIMDSARFMLRNEGFLSFWRGNGINVMRVIPNYGLRFSFNDKAREIVAALRPKEHRDATAMTKTELFLAGSLAGIGQISITYPLEVVFTRVALSGAGTTGVKYNGIIDCFRRTLVQEGPRAFYSGYLPTLLSGTPYVALQMSCYEIFQRNLCPIYRRLAPADSKPAKEPVSVKLIAGALAGLVAQTLTFPGDVVRKRMQMDGMDGNPKVYNGMIDATVKIARREGFKGFFAGVQANSWRCLPEGAIMFAAFDFLKHIIGIKKFDQQ